jgi:hypothetical protein
MIGEPILRRRKIYASWQSLGVRMNQSSIEDAIGVYRCPRVRREQNETKNRRSSLTRKPSYLKGTRPTITPACCKASVIRREPRPAAFGFTFTIGLPHFRATVLDYVLFASRNLLYLQSAMKSFARREATRLLSQNNASRSTRIPASRRANLCIQEQRRAFHGSRRLLVVKPYLLADIGEGK